jgi:hypothetical protein
MQFSLLGVSQELGGIELAMVFIAQMMAHEFSGE